LVQADDVGVRCGVQVGEGGDLAGELAKVGGVVVRPARYRPYSGPAAALGALSKEPGLLRQRRAVLTPNVVEADTFSAGTRATIWPGAPAN
jgi:hypothetical protein